MEKKSKKRIKLLSFNINIKPPSYKKTNNDHKNTRTNLFLHQIKNYDIIALQEIFGIMNSRKQQIIDQGKRESLGYHATASSSIGLTTSFMEPGLLTMSSFNIRVNKFKKFKSCKQQEKKGLLYTMIDLGEYNLHLFNVICQKTPTTHYDPYNKDLHKSRLLQFSEIPFLMENMLAKYGKIPTTANQMNNDAILLAGTLNTDARGGLIPKHLKTKNALVDNWISKNIKIELYQEYQFLLSSLQQEGRSVAINWGQKSTGNHPVTLGDCFNRNRKNVPRETLVTSEFEQCSEQCLDYIFQIVPPGFTKERFQDAECKVVPFFVDSDDFEAKGKKITQISSHYGLCFEFSV